MSNPIARFEGEKYLNLETFRKSGEGVKTPVWFVIRDGELYTSTPAQTGKVKRLRNNPAVRIVPCDAKGTPNGEWLDATVTLLDEAETAAIEQLNRKKYGFQHWILGLFGKIRGWKLIGLKITLP